MWRDVLSGEVSREDGHAWAAEWVEAEGRPPSSDRTVSLGLLYLHGFDMAFHVRSLGVEIRKRRRIFLQPRQIARPAAILVIRQTSFTF